MYDKCAIKPYQGGLVQPREKFGKLLVMRKKYVRCLIAQNFLLVGTTSSTYRLGAVASLKFLVSENIPRITAKLRIVD